MASLVVFRTVEVFPALVKRCSEMACPKYFTQPVRDFVEAQVSPKILRRELDRIKKASTFGDMTVTGSSISREITALYVQDDFTLTVLIKMPLSFSLRRAEVDCSKTLGVPATNVVEEVGASNHAHAKQSRWYIAGRTDVVEREGRQGVRRS